MRKLYQRWLNQRMANLLETLLNNGMYADMAFMCPTIKRYTPPFGGLFIYTKFIKKHTTQHVHKTLGDYLTLFGYMKDNKLWDGNPGKAFIEQMGIPFYRNMIKELREEK